MSGAPELGHRIEGKYQLERFLGQGAAGAVYEATNEAGERVALKVLLLSADDPHLDRTLGRFEREVVVGSTVDSPHVVKVLDTGFDEAAVAPYLVMPLLAGEDIERCIAKNGPLHPSVAVRLVRQACKGMAAAHEAGVVHRDIKPGNLFLAAVDGHVQVKVVDLGLAKVLGDESGLTATGAAFGTPLYMAPEQFADAKRVDPRADVYSLAATLYELLGGRAPFGHLDSLSDLIVAVCGEEAPHLQDHAPWVDPALAHVVHGALLLDAEARCPSMDDFAEALLDFDGGTEEVIPAELVGLSEDAKAITQQRMDRPAVWSPPEVMRATELPPTEHAEEVLLGHNLGDSATILWKLGAGGMGAVYEAAEPDGRRVAIKVLPPGFTRALRKRFAREAEATRAIESDHVVRVLRADAEGERPYIVMELLSGEDLDQAVHRLGAIDPKTAARAFSQAATGLAAAHDAGLVHRDVKPANLFLHELPSGGRVVKVCDFGIAKDVTRTDETSLTRTGGVVGSPMYMSPEQAKNAKSLDARSDVWSLGASLYHALTGAPPWEGRETVGELILAIHTDDLPHVQDAAPWVPPALADVVHRAMSRRPEERFATAREMREALEAVAGDITLDEPLRAASSSMRERVADRVSREGVPEVPSAEEAPASEAAPSEEAAPPERVAAMAVSQAGGTLDSAVSTPASAPPAAPSRAPWFALAAAVLAGGAYVALTTGSSETGVKPATTATATASVAAPSKPAPTTTGPTAQPTASTSGSASAVVKPPPAPTEAQGRPPGLPSPPPVAAAPAPPVPTAQPATPQPPTPAAPTPAPPAPGPAPTSLGATDSFE